MARLGPIEREKEMVGEMVEGTKNNNDIRRMRNRSDGIKRNRSDQVRAKKWR